MADGFVAFNKTQYHLHVLDVGTVEEINDIATQNLLSHAGNKYY